MVRVGLDSFGNNEMSVRGFELVVVDDEVKSACNEPRVGGVDKNGKGERASVPA
jgi:hypothetical protein